MIHISTGWQGVSGLLLIGGLPKLLIYVFFHRKQLIEKGQKDPRVPTTCSAKVVKPWQQIYRGGVCGLGGRKEARYKGDDLTKGRREARLPQGSRLLVILIIRLIAVPKLQGIGACKRGTQEHQQNQDVRYLRAWQQERSPL